MAFCRRRTPQHPRRRGDDRRPPRTTEDTLLPCRPIRHELLAWSCYQKRRSSVSAQSARCLHPGTKDLEVTHLAKTVCKTEGASSAAMGIRIGGPKRSYARGVDQPSPRRRSRVSPRPRARCRIAPTGARIMGEGVGRTALCPEDERNSSIYGGCHIRRTDQSDRSPARYQGR